MVPRATISYSCNLDNYLFKINLSQVDTLNGTIIDKEDDMRGKFLFGAASAAAFALTMSGAALAFDMQAGPIMNQQGANQLCPNVCTVKWNGQWRTTVPGQMSVCGCSDPPL
jgi:Mannan-binding protein